MLCPRLNAHKWRNHSVNAMAQVNTSLSACRTLLPPLAGHWARKCKELLCWQVGRDVKSRCWKMKSHGKSQHVPYDIFPTIKKCHQIKAYVQHVSYPHLSSRQDMFEHVVRSYDMRCYLWKSIHELCMQRAQIRHMIDLCLCSSWCDTTTRIIL